MPITEDQMQYAQSVAEGLKEFRVKLDTDTGSKLGYRIRRGQTDLPYMLVVGSKEVESGVVSVRHGVKGDLGQMSLDEFKSMIKGE